MQPFESVREDLLRAGIAAGHVNRYVVELREHMADLVSRERASGADARDAAAKARTLMGSDAQLVQAMLDRSPPRALAVRAPWAVFGLLPAGTLIVVTGLVTMAMFKVTLPVRHLLPGQMSGGYQLLIAAASVFTGYVMGPMLAALCIAIALRQRLSNAWVWAGLAVIATVSGLFAFHVPANAGDMYRATMLITVNGRVDGMASLILVAARTSVLFVLAAATWRMFRSRQTGAV